VPLLLYCVAKSSPLFRREQRGVADLEVKHLDRAGLAAYFSRSATPDAWLRSRLRDSALQFNNVLNDCFRQAAIIPFRFPTIVESENELAEHVDQRASEYNAWLEKFKNKAQMDVRVRLGVSYEAASSSGTKFLRARQEQQRRLDTVATDIQTICRDVSAEWLHRPTADGFRAFALLDRNKVESFKEALAAMTLPKEFEARISGPWPVSEFLEPIHGA
jgi:hypothetical protein